MGREEAYLAKPGHYFGGARPDFVEELRKDVVSRVLEVGCGMGGTARLAREAGRVSSYCAIELSASAAETARQYVDEIIVGDIETLDLPWQPRSFNVLILSEVLEHLVDPYATLRKLHHLMHPGGIVLASSPNVGHYGFILMLLRGDWRLENSGPHDRTHLRWFTPKTYRRMFEECGYEVQIVKGVAAPGPKARVVRTLLGKKSDSLLLRQIWLKAKVR
jgi:2-polyprenyl-3-methyl-5-hydroxy-6-metoxy-1,4-benzoquinol methylase